jgi:hypothetical protein
MRKVSILAVVAILAALVVGFTPQSAAAKAKAAGELRWHGVIVRISEDGSVFTVRKGNVEKAIHVTADTKYTKAGGKTAEASIDKGEIKEGDDVICIGKAGDKKEFVAERISRRLAKNMLP